MINMKKAKQYKLERGRAFKPILIFYYGVEIV